ncbi:MAG TPA: hypothetical protein VK783_07045 [Bacteroidia bacterium]|jgi:hypothetical protein|nr:hypothetical protein [Bacteroidia bacterium]
MKKRALLFSALPIIIVLIEILIMVISNPGNHLFEGMVKMAFFTTLLWTPCWIVFLIYAGFKKWQISFVANILIGIVGGIIFSYFLMICATGIGFSKM